MYDYVAKKLKPTSSVWWFTALTLHFGVMIVWYSSIGTLKYTT